jgi:hypothetical protein
MAESDPRTPGVADYAPRALGVITNIQMMNHHDLPHGFLAANQQKTHVDGIAVPDGNAVLNVLEQDMPGAAKRIGPGFEIAKILHHGHFNSGGV